jgi:hypothetical protein
MAISPEVWADKIWYESRVNELERWKQEAIQVLAQWEEVFKACDITGIDSIGKSKSALVLEYIEDLKAELSEAYSRGGE